MKTATVFALMRDRDMLHNAADNVARMVAAVRSGDAGWPAPVRSLHCDAYRNALEEALKRLDAVQAEMLPGARQTINTGTPAVGSFGSAA